MKKIYGKTFFVSIILTVLIVNLNVIFFKVEPYLFSTTLFYSIIAGNIILWLLFWILKNKNYQIISSKFYNVFIGGILLFLMLFSGEGLFLFSIPLFFTSIYYIISLIKNYKNILFVSTSILFIISIISTASIIKRNFISEAQVFSGILIIFAIILSFLYFISKNKYIANIKSFSLFSLITILGNILGFFIPTLTFLIFIAIHCSLVDYPCFN